MGWDFIMGGSSRLPSLSANPICELSLGCSVGGHQKWKHSSNAEGNVVHRPFLKAKTTCGMNVSTASLCWHSQMLNAGPLCGGCREHELF